jgi:hypothetical protein
MAVSHAHRTLAKGLGSTTFARTSGPDKPTLGVGGRPDAKRVRDVGMNHEAPALGSTMTWRKRGVVTGGRLVHADGVSGAREPESTRSCTARGLPVSGIPLACRLMGNARYAARFNFAFCRW